jgi:hypothetical protein
VLMLTSWDGSLCGSMSSISSRSLARP